MTFARIHAGDTNVITFIVNYIVNEQKPTFLIFSNSCWTAQQKVKLTIDLSNAGFRSSGTAVLPTDHIYHHLLFLVDFECPNATEVIYDAISRKLFASPFRWLMLTSSINKEVLSLVLNSPILADSDVVLSEKLGEVYKLTESK
ncbi:unnamed protein product [Chilo suppressalis]|uniref:Uncharacterized protein n=1 Tax=Chilo suppressalis TaxID=168631 RepID=A0ABN8B2L5_CHISP|nr:unnamed protein product [Chilo suppressalis]